MVNVLSNNRMSAAEQAEKQAAKQAMLSSEKFVFQRTYAPMQFAEIANVHFL